MKNTIEPIAPQKSASKAERIDDAYVSAIVESSDDAIISKNLDGIIMSWNKGGERIFGYRREEAIGQPIYILIPPELVEEEVSILGRLSRGERIEHYETVRLRKDGSRFDASLTISPVKKRGRIIGASTILRDITARKHTERELRRRTAELTAFVETAAIGLHWVGPDGTVLWANAAEMELLGYRPEEYIGHHIAEFHADEPAINDILGCLSRGEKLCEYEARLKCKDGSIKHVVIDSSVLWEDGRFIHTQCFTRDVTQRKTVEEELRRSAFILNQSGWAVATVNSLTDRIDLCNPAFAQMHGYKAEELKGKPLTDTFAPEWLPNWPQHLAALRLGGDYIYESLHIRKDGSTFPVRTHATTFKDDQSRPVFRAAIFEDITERRRAETALRESEERFRTLADNISQFAWMADETGWIFWYNKRWFEYTGTTLEEMQGWGWQQVHHPEHVERVVKKIRHCFVTGEAWEDTFPLRGKDGQYRWFLSRAIPIRNAQGKILRWFGTNTDITERLQTGKALEEAHQELAQRAVDLEKTVAERTRELQGTIAELESFSYSMSHDLRAPLRAIVSFSQLLGADCGQRLGPPSTDYVERIIRAADRMDRLIQDVLTYSQLVRQNVSLDNIDIEALLKQIIAEHPSFQKPAAHIEIQTPLLRVMGHEASLTQCIYNLIGNAIKFVAPGVTPRIKIWSEAIDSNVRVWFEDNGIGIPRESQQAIFGMFQRLHREDKYPGTGIGLAIVRKAVERMGGRAGVESEPGQGSRFWMELPHPGLLPSDRRGDSELKGGDQK